MGPKVISTKPHVYTAWSTDKVNNAVHTNINGITNHLKTWLFFLYCYIFSKEIIIVYNHLRR